MRWTVFLFMVRVYTPTTGYTKKADTTIQKIDLIAGIMTYGRLITKHKFYSTISTSIIYQVPDGKVFFLVAIHYDFYCGNVIRGGFLEVFFNNYIDNRVISCVLENSYDHANGDLTFPIPLKFNAGETVSGSADPNVVGNGLGLISVIGYEVPTQSLPLFV